MKTLIKISTVSPQITFKRATFNNLGDDFLNEIKQKISRIQKAS